MVSFSSKVDTRSSRLPEMESLPASRESCSRRGGRAGAPVWSSAN